MEFFQVFFPITILLCSIESREYHYDKPALPFYENPSPNSLQTPANLGVHLPTVIQTSGPNPKNYEIYDVKSSRQVFQSNLIPQAAAYQNTLQNSVNYNQVPRKVPSAPIYGQQGLQQAVTSVDVKPSQSYLLNPLNGKVIRYAQNTPQYRTPIAPPLSTHLLSNADLSSVPSPGNYVSQSEAGHLDIYTHKQQGGNDRTYKRIITTCYPNGQCERLQLNAGPTDITQHNVVWSTRTYTAPVPNKCVRIAEAKRQSAYGVPQSTVGVVEPQAQPIPVLVRPPNRRLFPYSEIVLPRDPYN